MWQDPKVKHFLLELHCLCCICWVSSACDEDFSAVGMKSCTGNTKFPTIYIVLPSSHKVPPVCRQYPSLNYSPKMLHQMWSKGWGHAEAAWAFEQSVGKSPRFWWSCSGIQRAELHAILTDFVFPTSQYCVSSIIYAPVNVIVLHDCLGRHVGTPAFSWGMSG